MGNGVDSVASHLARHLPVQHTACGHVRRGRSEHGGGAADSRCGGAPCSSTRLACAIVAVLTLSAPVHVHGQAQAHIVAPSPQHIRTLVGCTPTILMSAGVRGADPAALPRVWSRIDDSLGLPRNSQQMCAGSYVQVPNTGLQVCGSQNLSVSMTPEKAQAGRSFTTRVLWERAVDATKTPKRLPGRPGDGNVAQVVNSSATFMVVEPAPAFQASADEAASHVFTIGCQGSVTLLAHDTAAPVDLGMSGCSSSRYELNIKPIAAGSYPPTPTGMPQAVALPAGGMGGMPSLVPLEGDTPSSRKMEFRWVPERGQERSTPYRICFQCADIYELKHQVKCITVKVQKCVYCAREGDSIASIASQYDTDWLHLYTTNPLITNPDALPAGTRINTGVLYEVRKGDYLELLYDRFFVEEQQLLVCMMLLCVALCVCVHACSCEGSCAR